MNAPPTITIITLTLDANIDIWEQTLQSIANQDYPKEKISHIVTDGGSINGTAELAKKYGCKVYVMPQFREQGERRKGIGIKLAKGDIVAFIESDNILPERNWFRRMVLPFLENDRIVGTFSAYNSYCSSMPLLTKYCALFGVNDPTVYYLNKSEKIPQSKSRYDKGENLSENENYYVVRFNRESLPTLGDNGHMVRKELIDKVNEDPKKFIHVDAFANLLALGYDTYGVVKNSIIHYTGSNLFRLFRRRTTYKGQFYNVRYRERTYFIFNSRSAKDRWNLFRFIVFSLTFIQPVLESIRGYMRVPEPAWFLHPLVCLVAVLMYTQSELEFFFKKRL